jgi:hypothetical protein
MALAARLASAAAATPATFVVPPPLAAANKRRRVLVDRPPPPPPPRRARAPPPAAAAPTFNDDNDNDDEDLDDLNDPDTEGGRGSGRFRFWYDEQRFKGRPESCVVPSTLERCGGVRTGGHPKRSPVPGPLGWSRPGEWDLLWSPARTALQCAEARRLRSGQLCSALPGMAAITRKRRLADSLLRAYGDNDDAEEVCPLTFELPGRLDAWRACLDDEEAKNRRREGGEEGGVSSSPPSSSRWMLKTAEHMGQGLALMAGEEAYAAAKEQARRLMRRAAAAAARRAKEQQQGATTLPLPASAAATAASSSSHHKPFLLAQRYVEDPLLLRPELKGQRQQLAAGGDGNGNNNSNTNNPSGGRKFGLRLWMVVTGVDPLRAHVFKRGLVLFSDVPYCQAQDEPPQAPAATPAPLSSPPSPQPQPPPRAHVTNYAANADGDVWDLEDLECALGAESFALVWRRCLRGCALAAAAALSSAREEKTRLRYPRESCFELIGLDFLVDSNLRPWLLEANSTPSMTAEHSDEGTRERIKATKTALVQGAMRLLDAPGRFDARYAPLRAWVAAKRRAVRGGGGGAALMEAARLEPGAAAATKALVGGGKEAEEEDDDEGAAAVAAAVAELKRAEAAGFEPLYGYMPYDEVFERGWDVGFGKEDFAMRDVWSRRREGGTSEVAEAAAPTAAAPMPAGAAAP